MWNANLAAIAAGLSLSTVAGGQTAGTCPGRTEEPADLRIVLAQTDPSVDENLVELTAIGWMPCSWNDAVVEEGPDSSWAVALPVVATDGSTLDLMYGQDETGQAGAFLRPRDEASDDSLRERIGVREDTMPMTAGPSCCSSAPQCFFSWTCHYVERGGLAWGCVRLPWDNPFGYFEQHVTLSGNRNPSCGAAVYRNCGNGAPVSCPPPSQCPERRTWSICTSPRQATCNR